MSNERTIHSDFGEAIEALKKRQLSPFFFFKSRMLGSLIDIAALHRRGWSPVPLPTSNGPFWNGCMLFQKVLKSGSDPEFVRIGTSELVQEDPNGGPILQAVPGAAEGLEKVTGKDPAWVFLREVHFFRSADGGLRQIELFDEVPDEAIASTDSDLSECTVRNWTTFAADLAYQTDGLDASLPPHVFPTDFCTRAAVLGTVLNNAMKKGRPWVPERLLVRFIRTLVDSDYDPESRELLEAYPDGWNLWNFVYHWFISVHCDGAAWRLLAYALDQADDLSAPYTESAWSGFSILLRQAGFFRESILAADRALSCSGATEREATTLWNAIVAFIRNRFPGDDPTDKPVNVAWLIQILFLREDSLKEMDGYWTLLGLAMAVNGNDLKTAAKTLEKDFSQEDAPEDQRGSIPEQKLRDWQAFASLYYGAYDWIRRALAVFPDPVLSKPWTPFSFPETTIPGMSDIDFLEPVFEFGEDGANAIVDASSWKDKVVRIWEDELARLVVPEVSMCTDGVVIATRTRRYQEDGAEIKILLVDGLINFQEPESIGMNRVLPLASPGTQNVMAAPWEYFPYLDNGCGEIRFRIDNGPSLCGASVFFAADREPLLRGKPLPTYVYALGLSVHHSKRIGPVTTLDGKNVDIDDSRFIFEHPDSDTKALYEFHAEVKSIRRVKVSGGGEVLCLDLDVGDARIPCDLPLYVRESLIDDPAIAVGDVLDGILFLQVDFFPPNALSRKWLAAHPDGPGDEPEEKAPGINGYPISFRKRSPDGKIRIPVLGEEPGKTTEVDDTNPTPESFDAVEAAFRRLQNSYGCEEIVRWDANPEGIDFAARVHGLVLRYHVIKVVGDGNVRIDRDWNPDRIQPLVVRLRDAGNNWAVEYERFPLLEAPKKATDGSIWNPPQTKKVLRYLLAEGITHVLGYDMENIVDMACSHGAEFLDEVLSKLERLGENVDWLSHAHDKEGFCAVQLYRNDKAICDVFGKHGVSSEYTVMIPTPDSDAYELVTEQKTIENMERTARKWHDGQFRKDGKTPYIEHPKAVAELLGKWGFQPEWDGWAVAVAWGHDILEEAPPEKRKDAAKDIRCSVRGLLNEQDTVLNAIQLLTRDKTVFPNKADYIRHVAETAAQPVLAVKIADRLCNTRDFLRLPGAGAVKAREYLAEGQPLFDHLGKVKFASESLPESVESRIRDEIELVRKEIETASAENGR